MTHSVDAAFVKVFEAEVHQAYQEEGEKLASTVRTKSGVVGSAVQFPIYGKGAATARGLSASEVKTMGVGATKAEAMLSNFIAAEYSDVFDEAALNFDDRMELAKCIGRGIRRTEDQLIISSLLGGCGVTVTNAGEQHTAAFTGLTSKVGDGTTALTLDMLRKAKRKLDEAGVPSSERYCVLSPAGIESMLADTSVGSIDFNNVKALVNGEVDTFMGFKFVMVADNVALGGGGQSVKTGLPLNAGKRLAFVFHKSAIGYGVAIDKTTYADWVATHAAFLIQSHLKAGAVAIDKSGMVAINYAEAAL